MATTYTRTTRIYYEGDGATTEFTIPFEYLAKRFVQVYIDNELQKGGDYSDSSATYYFSNTTTIKFKTAPATGAQVLIKRFTDATDRIVTFQDASVLLANDLNAAQVQTIHIAEEGRDIIDDALIVDTESNWDARNRRIINLADPVDPQDAMTLNMYLEDSAGVLAAKDEALKAVEEVKKYVDDIEVDIESINKLVESAGESAAIAESIRQEVENKYNDVTQITNEITAKANEVLEQFEEVSQDVANAAQTVLETKDYIDTVVNSNVVLSGIACARSTWVLKEDLPAGTVIKMEGSPTYVVGRKHLFISYDGIVMSPTFYNEVGDLDTVSTQVSFNFDLYKGQEISAWVIPLGSNGEGGGTIDPALQEQIARIESNLTTAQGDITSLENTTATLSGSISDLQDEVDALKSGSSGGGSSGGGDIPAEVLERLDNAELNITEISQDITTLTQDLNELSSGTATSISELQQTDTELRQLIENINTGSGGSTVIANSFGIIDIGGKAEEKNMIKAESPDDVLAIIAGSNVGIQKATAQSGNKKCVQIYMNLPDYLSRRAIESIQQQLTELAEKAVVEVAVVDSVDNAPSELKVGGILFVKGDSA